MNTRDIFKHNLNYFIERSGKNKKAISEEMQIPYTTLVDWANGSKFPRADGIERLAGYFKILKSDLLEEKSRSLSESRISEDDIKVALFGGDDKNADKKFADVKRYIEFLNSKED